MAKKTVIAAVLATLVATTAAACGGGSSSTQGNAQTGVQSTTGGGSAAASSASSLNGAGSSLVYPLVSNWIPDYQKKHGVTVTYGPVGSGGGIQAISSKTVDFGASDAPLTADQKQACGQCVEIPWALSATTLSYDVPGAPRHLKLDASTIAGIYLGQITNWNDPRIAKLNGGAKLPALKITPVYRSDGSGDTFAFTDYLSHVSPQWASKVGNSTSVSFPTGVGGKGNSGVAGIVGRTKGAIGYISVAYAAQNDLQVAAIRNRAGVFALPDLAGIAAAANAMGKVRPDNTVSIVNPPASAKNGYPISTFTYAIVHKQTPKAQALKQFLTYAIGPGQSYAPKLVFAKLPQKVLQVDRKAIASIG